MRFNKLPVIALAVAMLASTMAIAADEPSEQVKRLDASANVLNELMGTPDKGIPEEILDSAECIAVVPSMVKIGLVFGGRHGRGMTVCRTKSGWSAPHRSPSPGEAGDCKSAVKPSTSSCWP